jgi:mono/diheme cytochrome c family protein
MKKSILLALLPMTALLGVAGCDDGYSDAIVYALRTDPIKKIKLGFEPIDPDRPGQLPLLSIKDLNNEQNPYYKNNKEKNLVENENFCDPTMASSKDREQINAILVQLFGTPAIPKVGPMSNNDRNLLELTEGPEGTLVKGSKLYRIHCLHCHGVSGDGRGPTARWVNPHPRDYRQGHFKFVSVDQTQKQTPPHRDDLLRVLEIGIEGTAMPSFVLLPLDERKALVSYVIHLSLRGQTEYKVFNDSFEYKKAENTLRLKEGEGSIKEAIMGRSDEPGWYDQTVNEWVTAQSPDKQIKIAEYPFDPNDAVKFKESVLRGKEIFTNPPEKYKLGTNACMTCHKEFGRRSTFREDEWGTLSKPNNLIQGVFRGGRRPVDVYRRVHSGIMPSGMIAFGSTLQPNDIWDLVNFVQVLGSPTMRREMGIFVD